MPSKRGDEGDARQRPSSDRSLLAKCLLLPSFFIRTSDVWDVPGFCKKGSEAALLSQG